MKRLDLLHSHINQSTEIVETPASILVQINRKSAKNSINFTIAHSIIANTRLACKRGKAIVIAGKSLETFAAGGCLKLTTERVAEVPEFLRSLHEMFFLLAELPVASVSLWSGYVIGTGGGVACSCKLRVAMPCSVYSMPENLIGLYPNVGGTYYLTHFVPEGVGMYLCLTGLSLKGALCYKYGLCNYFIEDTDFEVVLEKIRQGTHPYHVLKEFHKEPRCFEPFEEEYVNQCFVGLTCVEEAFERVQKLQHTAWGNSVLAQMNKLCPLSMKVAFRAFMQAKHLSFAEALKADYSLEVQLMVRHNFNFQSGARFKVKKQKSPPWLPATLAEVSEALIDSLFNSGDLQLNLPKLLIDYC